MAHTPFSLLLLRRLSLSSHSPEPPFRLSLLKSFSTSQVPPSSSSSSDPPPKPSSLSARLSFVFDQIDAIEKQQQNLISQKDQTLQRIRAWRQSKQSQVDQPQSEPSQFGLGSAINDNDKVDTDSISAEGGLEVVKEKKEAVVEVVHPWPEWIELMQRLVKHNYFDHRRKDEDRMIEDLGFDASKFAAEDDKVELDFTDYKVVQTACLNFGKDRFDILRSLSRQDIQILVGFGCPSVDKKVVFSAKLLRKYVHLDEGDVCSSCSLRNSCERGYLLTNKEDEARTIDIMRVLLMFGFDPVNGSVINKALLKQKSVRTVVRKLLHEVVKLSSVPIDPNLPPPIIKKPPPKVKQPPPPPKKRVGRDDVEMKKGDWLCPKCDFMNFAKNTICLQCDAKRPKRQLLPGEWECPECNFLNYRRNMACFHCECKRPTDELMETRMQEKQHGPRTRLEKIANRQEVSNAWNFDFDDNESDGADVAAFEYADSSIMAKGSSLNSQAHGGNLRGPEGDFNRTSRAPRIRENEYSDDDTNRPGFDDFDDEEDDIDSYELDTPNNNSTQKASANDFSEVKEYSGSEDFEGLSNNVHSARRTTSPSYNKPSKSAHLKATFSGSEDDLDSDDDLSVHPNWKSSHVADFRQRGGRRGQVSPSKGLSFGSDEELGLNSDVDDDLDRNFRSEHKKGNRLGSERRDFQRKRSFVAEDTLFSDEDDDDIRSSRNRVRQDKVGIDTRRNKSQGRANQNFTRDAKFRSSGKMGGKRHSFNDDFDEPSQGFRGNSRGSRKTSHDGWRKNDREGDMRDFKGRRRGDSFGNQQRGRHNEYDRDMDGDVGGFKNSRRVIER